LNQLKALWVDEEPKTKSTLVGISKFGFSCNLLLLLPVKVFWSLGLEISKSVPDCSRKKLDNWDE